MGRMTKEDFLLKLRKLCEEYSVGNLDYENMFENDSIILQSTATMIKEVRISISLYLSAREKNRRL